MASKYTVTRNYCTQTLAYDEGSTVEVDDEVAAWVNRDSPGTLVPARKSTPEPSPEAHVCEECGFEAASRAGLSAHARVHQDES